MTDRTDEQLAERLRAALGARALSLDIPDATQRVALARSMATRRRRPPLAILGMAAALIVALVAGSGFVGWRLWTEGRSSGMPAGPTATTTTPAASVEPSLSPSSTLPSMAAPIAGQFGSTGSMGVARFFQTATLLRDGRVLIAGGCDDPQAWQAIASAELYDPKTGTFSATGSMMTGRCMYTATLLQDGRVLVVGGWSHDRGWLTSAELYDPKTGTFSGTGLLAEGRQEHTATLLRDGRVLIAGGTGTLPGSAEIFDPQTGEFTPTGPMMVSRVNGSATLLQDGRVLLVGGSGPTGPDQAGNYPESLAFASAEIYDPTTGEFSATGSMATARRTHTAILLGDGRVLVAAGLDGNDRAVASAELFDPKTGTFSRTGALKNARSFHTATLLADGRVLVIGGDTARGFTSDYAPLRSAELYDPRSGTFSQTGSLATARTQAAAALLPDGRVLVAGGLAMTSQRAMPVTSAELYQP